MDKGDMEELLVRLDERSARMEQSLERLSNETLPGIWKRLRKLEWKVDIAGLSLAGIGTGLVYFKEPIVGWFKKKVGA